MPSVTEAIEPTFCGEPKEFRFAGLLFDMDGTIVDSTDAIIKHWHKIGKELGVDPAVIMQSSHGRRSIDTLQLYDPTKANWNYVSHIEGLIPKEYGSDAVTTPGARDLLGSLQKAGAPWAIVTSGTKALLTGWLDVMKLAQPHDMIVAEDVEVGKPAPECYQLGMKKLGIGAHDGVLVIEDAPAGIRAGKAAGCMVLGLATTHNIADLREAKADLIVKDLQSVKYVGGAAAVGGVKLEISDTLKL